MIANINIAHTIFVWWRYGKLVVVNVCAAEKTSHIHTHYHHRYAQQHYMIRSPYLTQFLQTEKYCWRPIHCFGRHTICNSIKATHNNTHLLSERNNRPSCVRSVIKCVQTLRRGLRSVFGIIGMSHLSINGIWRGDDDGYGWCRTGGQSSLHCHTNISS